MNRRWLFADQPGPHVLDDPRQPALPVESKAVFRRTENFCRDAGRRDVSPPPSTVEDGVREDLGGRHHFVAHQPRTRLGVDACPYAFLDRLDDAGLAREQDLARGNEAP